MIIYPTIKEMPIQGLVGFGGGANSLTTYIIPKSYVGYCFDLYWSKFNSVSGTGVWSGAMGSKQTSLCSNNQMSDTNSAWVTSFDADTDTDYDLSLIHI